MNVFKMAWRNIWRNRRRTLVTLAAMTLALWVMILYSGLMEGFLRDLERNILDLELGDVQIFAPDYRQRPSIYNRIEDSRALLDKLDKAGLPASARLLGGGLAAGKETSAGISIRGLDPVRDTKVSDIYQHLLEGQWLDKAHPREVVLGRRLAKTLAVKPGDEVVVLSQAADGSMANDLFVVRGVLQSIADATDRTGLFMTDQSFRDFFNLPRGVHQIIVRRAPEMTLEELVRKVKEIAPGMEVMTWRELVPTLASMLDSSRGIIYIMFLVVYVAIAILILNAMLMSVFERIREFGVLKALGFGPKRVLLLIFTESAILTAMAVVLGLALSWPGLWYLSKVGINTGVLGGMNMMGMAFNPIWRAVISIKIFVGPVLTLLAIVMVAVIYPALKAARVSPVEAMRHL